VGTSTWIGLAALLALLVAASATDLRARRIPNVLVATGAILGLGLQAALPAGRGLFEPSAPGSIGLGAALLAGIVLLAAGMLLWRAGLFGAGDAKLLAAVGPFVGPAGVLPVLLYTLLAGGLLALAGAAARATPALRTGAIRLPYALAIAGGALTYAIPGAYALAAASAPLNLPHP
jgi:prepilin peptidase CpaA